MTNGDQVENEPKADETREANTRLKLLQHYAGQASPAADICARLVMLVSRTLRVPGVAINLIVGEQQCTIASIGRAAPAVLPLSESFCAHTIREGRPTIAADTRQDPRFRDLPAVQRQEILFYAAAPLISQDGLPLGALCITDHEPRLLNPQDEQLLSDYARLAVNELELLTAQGTLHAVEAQLRTLQRTLLQSLPAAHLDASPSGPPDEGQAPRPATQSAVPGRARRNHNPQFTRAASRVPEGSEDLADLRRLAYYDSLTGLPNRTLFAELLSRALQDTPTQGTLAAVGLLDLDAFKSVNDSLGHVAGDELLVLVAQRLSGLLRPDSTLARLGGDEYALLIPALERESDLVVIAERLARAFREPFRLAGRELHVQGSLGVAVIPLDATDERSAMTRADIAMYQAKRGRLGWARYTPGATMPPTTPLALEAALRQAYEQGELQVHFQPVVRAGSQAPDRFEALIRWSHPQLGNVPPAEFLPVAEQSGLISRIGLQVLREACRQVAQWRRLAPHLRVGVNFSAAQFSDPQLLDSISAALREHQLPPSALIVEVKESVLLEVPDAATLLGQLTSLGVSLSIDDFGTGYCNVLSLKHLQVESLKIDGSFLVDVEEHPDGLNANLLRSLAHLAHSIHLVVLMEGVETPGQARFVESIGFSLLQGHLFARPMPAEQVPPYLRTQLHGSSGTQGV